MARTDGASGQRRYVLRLCLVFTGLHLLHVLTVPAFQGPDENEHRQYVQALLDTHRLPVLAELPRDILAPAGYRIGVESVPTGLAGAQTPQAQQPPLSYLVYAGAEAVRRVSGLPEVWLRLVGLLWGWLTIVALAALGRELFDDQPAVRDGLPACILLPGPVYLCSVVSNDGAAMAAGAIVLWRLLRGLCTPFKPADLALLGLTIGLGLATKSTLLVYLPVALVAAVRWRDAGQSRWWAALVLVVAVLPVAWWWWHNQQFYGSPLVRAHARPTLYSLQHTLAASRDVNSDLVVLFAELIITSLIWLPTCVMPLWLLLARWWWAFAVGVACWIPALLCLIGPLRKETRRLTDTERHMRRVSFAIVGLLFVLYVQQFLFQDYLVSLFAGRYFLSVFGAILVPLLTGWSVSLGEHQDRAGRRLAAIAAALTVAYWPVVINPPSG